MAEAVSQKEAAASKIPQFLSDIPVNQRLKVVAPGNHSGPPGAIKVITKSGQKYYVKPDAK